MANASHSAPERTFRVLPALVMTVGVALTSLGILLLPMSLLGGTHITAIGGSLFLAGLASTRWAAARWNLSPADQRRWSMAFIVLTGVLTALFVIINYAAFDSEGVTIDN